MVTSNYTLLDLKTDIQTMF
jgi:dynein heavy chain